MSSLAVAVVLVIVVATERTQRLAPPVSREIAPTTQVEPTVMDPPTPPTEVGVSRVPDFAETETVRYRVSTTPTVSWLSLTSMVVLEQRRTAQGHQLLAVPRPGVVLVAAVRVPVTEPVAAVVTPVVVEPVVVVPRLTTELTRSTQLETMATATSRLPLSRRTHQLDQALLTPSTVQP